MSGTAQVQIQVRPHYGVWFVTWTYPDGTSDTLFARNERQLRSWLPDSAQGDDFDVPHTYAELEPLAEPAP